MVDMHEESWYFMLFIFSLKPSAFLTKSIPEHISLTKSEYIFVTFWQIMVFIIFCVYVKLFSF